MLLFLDWAEGFYRHPDGTPTGALNVLRPALRYLVNEHGRTRVREFGPLKLKQVRQRMIHAGCCRTNINRMVHAIRRVFSWGVENEYVPAAVYQALKAVPALKRGRTEAVEADPVLPVPESDVNETLKKLPGPLAVMVRLQLLTGARPGEVCAMRPCDVTIGTDGVWCYRPDRHKTAHHGKERRIYIGPEGQAVLFSLSVSSGCDRAKAPISEALLAAVMQRYKITPEMVPELLQAAAKPVEAPRPHR